MCSDPFPSHLLLLGLLLLVHVPDRGQLLAGQAGVGPALVLLHVDPPLVLCGLLLVSERGSVIIISVIINLLIISLLIIRLVVGVGLVRV